MLKHFFGFILLALLLLSSCKEEQMAVSDSIGRLNISFADDQTRSSWNDNTDTAGGKVSYVWENNDNNMLTAIKHGDQYVPFYASLSSAAQYHTPTKFETVDDAKSKIKLQTTLGVKYDVQDNAYVYPVAADDAMYCCHPINEERATVHSSLAAVPENSPVLSSPSAVQIDLPLPSVFTYTQQKNTLSSLADYSYVYTSTTLKSVDDNSIIANASHFNSACAIIRFNITNNISSEIIITGIKMEADDGSKIFPNVLRFADGTMAEQDDKSGYYNYLTTKLDQEDQEDVKIPHTDKGIFYNLCFPLDGDFNHVPLKFTIDTNYLTYQLRLNSDVITNNKFEAGKLYTFNFTLEEKEIHLNTIDISQCTTYNVDKAESLNIIVSPDAIWQQSASTSAQMVFVSLGMTTTIADKTYDVLWATCNLGAMEPIQTGNHYAWGEVEKKAASEYSPDGYTGTATTDIRGTEHDAVRRYLGDGYWLWSMPTKDMWQAIIDKCTWTWKTVKKVSDGGASEDNLDFDSSVWEVRKYSDDNKLTGLIYFPITGYSGLDTSDHTYKKVNKAMCCYWTSTPSTNTAGAMEKSWAFVTTYTVSGSEGHMSDQKRAMTECERYNGYCIRPVLLKERNN